MSKKPTASSKLDWRDAPSRRPSSFGGSSEEKKSPEPPMMFRSRAQIATAYAPGVLMTWEGGKGICKSVPIDKPVELPMTVRRTIFEGVREFAKNWLARSLAGTTLSTPEAALDAPFYDAGTNTVTVGSNQFQTVSPDVVGYVPYPLLYRCATCGSIREFRSVAEQYRVGLPTKCHGHEARWTQVDVVYVHWNGSVAPLSPFNNHYDPNTQTVKPLTSCGCGSQAFRLKNDAPVFAEWRYICEGCGDSRDLKKAEPDVLQRLTLEKDKPNGRQFEWIEVNMLPVSYRANNTFYPQRTSFIELKDPSVIDLMTEDGQDDLVRKLSEIHGIPFLEPTEKEIEQAVAAAGKASEWDEYQLIKTMIARREADGKLAQAELLRSDNRVTREKWFSDELVRRGTLLSPDILVAVQQRGEWSRRYDPIRLTVEHAAFVSEHIGEGVTNRTAVDVLKPDITLSDVVHIPEAIAKYQADVGNILSLTGIDRMFLLRGLPICEYSFGFSRVSSTPIYTREYQSRQVPMPVRLMAFDPLPERAGKRPIYVTQQNNEALYMKLDEGRVRRWLEANQVANLPGPDISIGRAYLESYHDFGPFLDEFRDKERQGIMPRELAPYVYMLLHSFSHQLIHSLADASGLDRDGIGEHIFPADLAFTIYRKGMTPDLGNISAMWRNHAMDFLHRSVSQRMLRCGSGSLCDSRGGACPACIMVSEVSCVSSNLLLSRAALKGGPRPEWEPIDAPDIVGFFDRCLDA